MRWSTKSALSAQALPARGVLRTLPPGPEAQQLAIYVGWLLLNDVLAGLIAGTGTPFVLPGVLTVLGLSAPYVGARDTTIVTAVLVVGLGHAAGHA